MPHGASEKALYEVMMLTNQGGLELVLAPVAGLIVGGHLNKWIYRMPRDLPLRTPASCPHCDASMGWSGKLPVVSYLLMLGGCRQCGHRLPVRYPLVEILTAVLFFHYFLVMGPTAAAVKSCVLAALLIALFFTCLETEILPDELTLGGTLAALVFSVCSPITAGTRRGWLAIAESLSGAILPGLILWLIAVLYRAARRREGIGFGCVKMLAMVGAFLGLRSALVTLVSGSVLGSLVGTLYVRLARKDPQPAEMPLGSFLSVPALGLTLAGSDWRAEFGWLSKGLSDWWGWLAGHF
jgi:leader peptidase (prepilin peptidase)/N-methyltransferase